MSRKRNRLFSTLAFFLYFFVSFLVSAGRITYSCGVAQKRHQKKKERWCRSFTFSDTNAAKPPRAAFFQNSSQRILKNVGFIFAFWVELLSLHLLGEVACVCKTEGDSLSPPLNQPNTTADFSNEPKGYIRIAGSIKIYL